MTPTSTIEPLKISVVMCTYDGALYLREQLDSILAQSYPIYEIIIQDDGSEDGTVDILTQYAAKDPRISIYKNDSGIRGINGNFFSAFLRATGDFIAVSDQDDIWEKDKLALQAAAIGERWLCSGFSVPFSTDGYPVSVDMRVPNYHLLRCTYLSPLAGHTLLFRRQMLSYLPNGARIPIYYDLQLVIVAAAKESIAFVRKKLVNFRRHKGAATATPPVGRKLFSSGAWNYVFVSIFYHRRLQAHLRKRFRIILNMLESLPFHTASLDAGIRMSRLQVGTGPINFVKKTVFFVRHSRYLFFTEEKSPIRRFLRAVFFSFSCGYYSRGILKRPDAIERYYESLDSKHQ